MSYRRSIVISFFCVAISAVKCAGVLAAEINDPSCNALLSTPTAKFLGAEDYQIGMNHWTRYRVEITNSAEYANELFAASSELPPCGLNKNSSRTWISLVSGEGSYLYGFCALSESSSLKQLWFAAPRGSVPPNEVYVEIQDRKCNKTVRSNRVSLR